MIQAVSACTRHNHKRPHVTHSRPHCVTHPPNRWLHILTHGIPAADRNAKTLGSTSVSPHITWGHGRLQDCAAMSAPSHDGNGDLPQEVLVRVFHFLPIKTRSRFACINRAWREASSVDAVQCRIKKTHIPSYLHVALPDQSAQLAAAACPVVSLARSAELMWAPATGRVLESMPSLERLAFSSMASEALPDGLESLRSLTNLQSLQMNIVDASSVLEAMPSVPATMTDLELHLHGDNWSEDILERITGEIGSQAAQLRHLSLRCSHASVYKHSEQMQSLTRLVALTSLRVGPNPEDASPKASPLGFPRLPSFLGAMPNLRYLDISIADVAHHASITAINFEPISKIPEVDLTLRADTSIREIFALPAALATVTGLTRLALHSFAFEDPGGWVTHGCFDVAPLAACKALRRLELRLRTWGAEHCEAFQVGGLETLSQLRWLEVSVAAPLLSLPQGFAPPQMPELRVTLPRMGTSATIRIAADMRVVLRNSKALAAAAHPAVLAQSILLEETLKRPAAAPAPAPAPAVSAAGAGRLVDADASSRGADQPTKAAAAAAKGEGLATPAQPQQQQYVRAAAHVVISALRDMWPGAEVWQYPWLATSPGSSTPIEMTSELLCREGTDRESLREELLQLLEVVGAGPAPLKTVQIA